MINTEHLLIRSYSTSDAAPLYRILRDDAACLGDYFPNLLQSCSSPGETLIYLEQRDKDWKEGRGFACGIFLKGSTILIGHISVREIDWSVPKGELSCFITSAYTGNGYATEALRHFRNWCFHDKKFNRLFMKVDTQNKASLKVAGRNGFKEEGVLRMDYRKVG